MKNKVEDEYYIWLCKMISSGSNKYKKLLNSLYDIEFEVEYPMDENRIDDGKHLKYRFGYYEKYLDKELEDIHGFCSMLEMMVALSIRMEESIMSDEMYGDRTGQWFWSMIDSLGLGRMTDSRFDLRKVERIIDDFINHKYESDGHGGLFIIDDDNVDLPKEEIWTQMNWYLSVLED